MYSHMYSQKQAGKALTSGKCRKQPQDRTPTLTGVRYRHSLDADAGHRFLSLVDHHLSTSSLPITKAIASLLCDLYENENDVSLTSLSINRMGVANWHPLSLAHCPLHTGTGGLNLRVSS
jgi:hypothetical protein